MRLSARRIRRAFSSAQLAVFAAWALTCVTRTVHADPASGVSLNWVRAEGAESCISGAQLERELGQLLAASGVTPTALVVEGIATRDPSTGEFGARLRVLDSSGRVVGVRALHGAAARCDQLTPSILLVLSLFVEFAAREQASAPPPRVADDARAPARRPARANAASSAPAPATSHFRVEPRAALSLSLGLNPVPSVGPDLSVQVHTPWWPSVALRAGYWPSGRIGLNVSPEADSASMEFHTFVGDLSLCLPLVRTVDWWFATCWGAAIAARKTRARGLDLPSSSMRVWAGASAALKLAYTVSRRWLLILDAGMLGFRQRDRYSYEDVMGRQHTAFRPAHFAGLFALGLGVRL